MYLSLNLLLLTHAALLLLFNVQCGHTMRISTSAKEQITPQTKVGENNKTSTAQEMDKLNATSPAPSSQPTQLNLITATTKVADTEKSTTKKPQHVVRIKRQNDVLMPFDFQTKHMPCDFDIRGRIRLIEYMPNHCIWMWNNKYTHEGFFRYYKYYQLEAFFFGQYYERLKRFEVDPHSFDYGDGS
ncbi:uncharacterized protein LOC115620787 [Scaptodrosophila lebanonensis]|uniref:Uncharacterized protein LOC115620787 n=1 Tax=Drosophila lebanonensis TaxID=7225 RepID=A0A6J2T565_DROLE|nr:uncharacterized protein LOC115620787 [Scaptodrosophila lebanonensis]